VALLARRGLLFDVLRRVASADVMTAIRKSVLRPEVRVTLALAVSAMPQPAFVAAEASMPALAVAADSGRILVACMAAR